MLLSDWLGNGVALPLKFSTQLFKSPVLVLVGVRLRLKTITVFLLNI